MRRLALVAAAVVGVATACTHAEADQDQRPPLRTSTTALASAGWKHVRVDRNRGVIEATLSYDTRPEPGFSVWAEYRAVKLVVRRLGGVVLDRSLPPTSLRQILGLSLRDVWGDSEPEALVEAWTGGNRCCTRIIVAIVGTDPGHVLSHDFWKGSPRGNWHRGRLYFVSSDGRFICGFSVCAAGASLIQTFAIDKTGRRFVDVTRSRPDLVRPYAARLWKHYLDGRGSRGAVGQLAPWCAAQYLLARKRRCDEVLEEERAKGYVSRAFIRELHKTLAEWGYAR
jgi:hypothetical protein